MKQLSELTLLSGVDIPFPEGGFNIHPPTLREIAYIGQEAFFTGCQMLKFSKNNLDFSNDNSNLKDVSDFDIILSMMKNGGSNQKVGASAVLVLFLLFPKYILHLEQDCISLSPIEKQENQQSPRLVINRNNFDAFKMILDQIFFLGNDQKQKKDYNPGGSLAKKIAQKMRKGKQKIAELKGAKEQKVSVFSRYVSILSVGQHKDMNILMNYTVYQLADEFKRFELKMNYDMYIQAKMAGAQDLQEVDSWMKDIHSDDDNKDDDDDSSLVIR